MLSEEKFADFELELDAQARLACRHGHHDPPQLGSIGFQVLLDHRPKGCIGGVYGNSPGSFLVPFAMTGDKLPGLRMANLRPTSPQGHFNSVTPTYGARFEDFLQASAHERLEHLDHPALSRPGPARGNTCTKRPALTQLALTPDRV